MRITNSAVSSILTYLFISSFTVSVLFAQEDLFSEKILINAGQDRVHSVFSCDLNGDESNDVISLSYEDHILCWYQNLQGEVGFGPQNLICDSIRTEIREGEVLGEDVDGDGDNDIIVTSNNIYWFENLDGLGTFSPPVLVCDTIALADKILCFDMDGDDDLDVVATDRLQSIAIWIENLDGTGNFGPVHVITNTIYRPLSFFCSDLDGDIDLDIVVVSGDCDSVIWFENLDGLGQFGSSNLISGACQYPRSVSCGDVDGDGDNDVIVGSGNDERVSLFRNTNGLGSFGTRENLTYDAADPAEIVLADLDNDEDLDILLASDYDSEVAWLRNNDGEGHFSSLSVITHHMDSPVTVFAADLDGDGDLDVLTGSSYDRVFTLLWIENTSGTGVFDLEHIVFARISRPTSLFADDIDSDGDNDIFVSANGDDNVSCFVNTDGNGFFGPQRKLLNSIDCPGMVITADINGDGIRDIVTGSKLDDWIAWYPGNGSVAPLEDQHLVNENIDFISSLHCADLDGDGDNDILASSEDDHSFIWHKNIDGNGNFGPQQVIAVMSYAASRISSADLDGDGDLDVIGSCYGQNGAFWFENTDGNGTFSGYQRIDESISGCMTIIPGDMDNDNDIDLITINWGNDPITWYENTNGLANFERVDFAYPPDDPKTGAISDIDSDGDLDLVIGCNNSIYWAENSDGVGTFTDYHLIDTFAEEFASMVIADLDHDGDDDILHSSGNDILAWYRNLTEGSPIQPFDLLTPDSGAVITTDTLTLEWENAPDLDNNVQLYIVYISDNESTLYETVYDSTSVSELTFTGETNVTYYWTVLGRDGHGYEAWANQVFSFTIETNGIKNPSQELLPKKFGIKNIYPNPFNPETVITLALPKTSVTNVSVFNVLGQEVAILHSGTLKAGYHNFTFSGQNLAGGCYFVKASSLEGEIVTKKIVLLK